jgi:uncharacterized protein YggU (UPF0235/DUF167 family)
LARITVRLTPRAGRDAIGGFDGAGVLRVRVAAPPVDDAANGALLRLLAKTLGIAPSRLTIARGGTARTKLIEVNGLTDAEILERLQG